MKPAGAMQHFGAAWNSAAAGRLSLPRSQTFTNHTCTLFAKYHYTHSRPDQALGEVSFGYGYHKIKNRIQSNSIHAQVLPQPSTSQDIDKKTDTLNDPLLKTSNILTSKSENMYDVQNNLEPLFGNTVEANIKVEYSDETFDQTRPSNNLNSKKTVLIFNFEDSQEISNLNQTFKDNSKLKIITCELLVNRRVDDEEHKAIKKVVFSIINILNNKNNENKSVNIQTDDISITSLEEYNVFKIMIRNLVMKALSHATQKNAIYSLVNSVHSQNTTNENVLNSDNKSRCEAVFKQSEKNKSIIMSLYNSVIKDMLHTKIENEENMKSIFTLVSQFISKFLNNKMPIFTITSPNETSYADINRINIKIDMNDETRHLLSQHIKQLQEFRQKQQIGYQFSTQQQKQEPHFRMQQCNNTYAQVQGIGMYNTKNWPRGHNHVSANVQVSTLQQIRPDQSQHTGFLQAVPHTKGQNRCLHSLGDFSGNNNNYGNQRHHPYRNQIQDLARPPGAQNHYDSNNNLMALHQPQQLQQNAMFMQRNNNWQQQDAAGLKQYIMPYNF